MIESGRTKARYHLEKVKVKYVDKDEILRFDPEKTSYFNINTKIDLDKAELIAASLPKIN